MHIDTVHDDARHQSARPVRSWEVVEKPTPFGNSQKNLRLSVTYQDGTVKVLAPSFIDRSSLDRYVGRFHTNFSGKEYLSAA